MATARAVNWWRGGAGLVIVAACFLWVLPTFGDYREVRGLFADELRSSDAVVSLSLIAVGIFNLIAPSVSQTAALPGLSLRRAIWADWSTTTVTNVIPGGSALAIGLIWAMYRSFGLARAAITRSIVVTGVWDVLVKLGTPLLALVWLSTQRPADSTFAQAAVIGGILFLVAAGLLATVLSGPNTARWIGTLLNQLPSLGDGWTDRLEVLRSETVELLRERGWSLTVWTVVGHANLYVLLVLCLRAVGIDRSALGWAAVLAAFAFGRLVTALPITPGGLGVFEVGLTGALAAVGSGPGQASGAALVAAVLLFRFLTFALPLPLGAIGLIWWNLGRRRHRADPTAKPTGPTKPEATCWRRRPDRRRRCVRPGYG